MLAMKLENELLARRIAQAIRNSNMSRAEIARALGVTAPAVHSWTSTGRISKGLLVKLAHITGVLPEWLITGGSALVATDTALYRVKLLSWAELGQVESAKTEGVVEVNSTTKLSGRVFALRVEGDAMSGELPAGVMIIVDPDRTPKPGDFVVASADSGAAVLRRLAKDGGSLILQATNVAYPPITSQDVTIHGVVIRMLRSFD